MGISAEDAATWQKILGPIVILAAFPLGVMEVVERFGGPSSTVIVVGSLLIAVLFLSRFVDLEDLGYPILWIALVTVFIEGLLIWRGFVNVDDGPFELIGTFIAIFILGYAFGKR